MKRATTKVWFSLLEGDMWQGLVRIVRGRKGLSPLVVGLTSPWSGPIEVWI